MGILQNSCALKLAPGAQQGRIGCDNKPSVYIGTSLLPNKEVLDHVVT